MLYFDLELNKIKRSQPSAAPTVRVCTLGFVEMNNNPCGRLCSGPALLFVAAGSMGAMELENSHENRDCP
jgi:hypothetical protein